MRPLLQTDIMAAARALLDVAPDARQARIRRLIAGAEAADRYRRRFGRAHPAWGNGTLMAAALARPLPRPPLCDDSDYLACQAAVIDALLERAAGQSARDM